MNRPDPLELDRWNRANERARREYRRHPFERSLHGARCGREGCRKGYAALVAQAKGNLAAVKRYQARKKEAS